MKVVDANVLLHAINESSPEHDTAKTWLDDALSGASPVGLAWSAMLAVIRLSTRPGLFEHPLTVAQVTGAVGGWIGAPSAVVLHPGSRNLHILTTLLSAAGTAGNLTGDAHLAALAIEHNAEIVSFDADFDRFPGVTWSRPSV